MTVGERIRELRMSMGISQVDLAKSVSITKQSLYKYEHNINTNIPSDKIELISKKLHVSPSVLMGWEVDIDNIDRNKSDQFNRIKKYCDLLYGLNDKGKEYVFKQIDFALSQDEFKNK